MAKNKKTYSPDPLNAGWMKWLVIAFIAYSVITSMSKNKDLAEQDFTQSNVGRRVGSSVTISGHGTQYGTKAFIKNMRIGGEITGQGDSIQCGEVATVSVAGTLTDGSPFFENEKPMVISVGTHDKERPWMAGVSGMSVGGIRELIVPATSFIDAKERERLELTKKDNVHFKVSLEKSAPTILPQKLPFRALEIETGKGIMALCGSKVKVNLDIWNADGSKIFTSRTGKQKGEIALSIGDSEVFYGLDRGLLGMKAGGRRSITVPISYLQSSQQLKKLLDSDIVYPTPPYEYIRKTLPEGQMVVVDISLMSVERSRK